MIRNIMEELLIALFFAAYWFAGGFFTFILTPYSIEAGLVGSIIGSLLLRAVW